MDEAQSGNLGANCEIRGETVMHRIELKAGGSTIARIGGVALFIAAIALSGAGFGCTAARPARSVTSPAATRPVSSEVTTEGINVQIQTKMAQRKELTGELKALDARIAEESGSSKTSIGNAKIQAMQAERSALATKLDALDAEIEAVGP